MLCVRSFKRCLMLKLNVEWNKKGKKEERKNAKKAKTQVSKKASKQLFGFMLGYSNYSMC